MCPRSKLGDNTNWSIIKKFREVSKLSFITWDWSLQWSSFYCTLKYPFPISFIGRGKIVLTVKIIFMYMEKSSQQIGVPSAFWHLTGDDFQGSLKKVMPIWPPTGNMTWSPLLKLVKPRDIYLNNWGDDNTYLIYQPVSVPWGESTWNLLHIAWHLIQKVLKTCEQQLW